MTATIDSSSNLAGRQFPDGRVDTDLPAACGVGVKYPTRPACVPKQATVPSGTSAMLEPGLALSRLMHSSR